MSPIALNRRTEDLFYRSFERLPLPGARVEYHTGFFNPVVASQYFDALMESVDWQQLPITLFGRHLQQPRLTAWYGDPGIQYSYSGNHFESCGWLEPLAQIRQSLEQRLGMNFNAVLCNRYRDGRDSMGWHADDERALGPNPVIASISLGATRQFRMRRKAQPSRSLKLDLGHGSLLLMSDDTQKNWQHCLPKVSVPCQERINLTFRQVPQPNSKLVAGSGSNVLC